MLTSDGRVKVLDFGLAKGYDTNPSVQHYPIHRRWRAWPADMLPVPPRPNYERRCSCTRSQVSPAAAGGGDASKGPLGVHFATPRPFEPGRAVGALASCARFSALTGDSGAPRAFSAASWTSARRLRVARGAFRKKRLTLRGVSGPFFVSSGTLKKYCLTFPSFHATSGPWRGALKRKCGGLI
jgi:hypothetical protein